MIMPIFTYCGVLFLNLTKPQNEKLQSLHRKSYQQNYMYDKYSINNKCKQEACMYFSETMSYFKIVTIVIKNNGKMVKC